MQKRFDHFNINERRFTTLGIAVVGDNAGKICAKFIKNELTAVRHPTFILVNYHQINLLVMQTSIDRFFYCNQSYYRNLSCVEIDFEEEMPKCRTL